MTNSSSESDAGSQGGEDPDVLNAFLTEAKAQVGDRFKMGAEASIRDDDPDVFDASELVKWAAGRAGVTVRDGSWHQYQQLHAEGAAVDVAAALDTPGALVFRFPDDVPEDPSTWERRPSGSHVAISLGDGRVLEATTGGVRIVEHGGRFTHGGSIPEITGTIEETEAVTESPPVAEAEPAHVDIGDPEIEPGPVGDDWAEKALDLRKQALDKSQAAEKARADLKETAEHRLTIEDKLEDSQRTAEAKESAMLDISARRQSASDEELARLDEEQAQLQNDLDEANEAVQNFTEDLNQFDEAFAGIEAEAKSLSDEAQTLRAAATETVTASLPEMNIKGSEDDRISYTLPGTLSGPVSRDRLRQWLAERNESAHQREQFAGRVLGQAEVDEDLADSYTQMAAEAVGRATTERAGVEVDRALIERLTVRKTEAEALEKRLSDEVEQESAQLERLREVGDAVGADAALEHVTGLLQRQFQWSGQASRLGERIEAKQASIQHSEEEAADYDLLASEFTNLAERHEGFADIGEKTGAALHDEIDSDEFLTDKVEDALATSGEKGLGLDFHLIDGNTDTEVHIEVEREAEPPQTAPETSGIDVATDALLAEMLDQVEFDAVPEADIGAESFEPTEIAGLQLDPVDDQFEQQIDVAEQFEDSLDDFLDDQA